jgi:hypothetical protein
LIASYFSIKAFAGIIYGKNIPCKDTANIRIFQQTDYENRKCCKRDRNVGYLQKEKKINE